MRSENVTLHLSVDEALVLFELLARFIESDQLAIEHASEEVALWNLQALLGKELVEPFQPDYQRVFASARARLAAGE